MNYDKDISLWIHIHGMNHESWQVLIIYITTCIFLQYNHTNDLNLSILSIQ